MKVFYVRNSDVKRVVLSTPKGHKHLRLAVYIGDIVLVFSEATVANIVRAYVTVKTHPVKRAVALNLAKLEERKPEYAEHQLLETPESEEELSREMAELLKNAAEVSSLGEAKSSS